MPNHERSKAHINKAISLAHNTDLESILKARNALSKMFDGKYKQDLTVYAVGHGHLDLAWLWPVRETKRKAIRTFSNAIYESEQCPSYVFNGSQPQQYEFIKQKSPKLFGKIKQAVENGNIEPQGGMWVSRIQIFLVEKALSVSAFTVRPISEKNFKRM